MLSKSVPSSKPRSSPLSQVLTMYCRIDARMSLFHGSVVGFILESLAMAGVAAASWAFKPTRSILPLEVRGISPSGLTSVGIM